MILKKITIEKIKRFEKSLMSLLSSFLIHLLIFFSKLKIKNSFPNI